MPEELQVQPFDSIFHDSATINEAFTTHINILKDNESFTTKDVSEHIFDRGSASNNRQSKQVESFTLDNPSNEVKLVTDQVTDQVVDQITEQNTDQVTDQPHVDENAPVSQGIIENKSSNIDNLPDQNNNNVQSIHDLVAKKNKEEESNDIENLQNKFNFLHGFVNNLDNSINEIKDQLHTLTNSKNSNILGNLSFCDNNILILICILIVITIVISQSKKKVYSILL